MRLLQVSFDSIENTFYRQHIPQVTDRDEVALRYLSAREEVATGLFCLQDRENTF
jgi:hypothetical protein